MTASQSIENKGGGGEKNNIKTVFTGKSAEDYLMNIEQDRQQNDREKYGRYNKYRNK
jgi:hypothetical protein